MVEKQREFGEIPHSAKTGPITLRNYSYRAEAHCKAKGRGPYPTIKVGTDDFRLWRQYFERHLGGLPMAMQRMLENPDDERQMTVPEEFPQWFDTGFEPDPRWRETEFFVTAPPGRKWPPIPPGQSFREMVAKHGVPVDHETPQKLERLINTPDSETPETVREKLGITPEAWDAMPDARKRA